ncbi:ATP-binding cassette domain-containing protein [Luteimonas sp. Y-2-2-4F]|nr:ATP-binding cassette domain-containing protein [Luteimonas sp. Y-2-2-4F]MCD9032669.1 ATP-binding cassette domain-containing protein [Luteimonas sp. Y-2-2-4F]
MHAAPAVLPPAGAAPSVAIACDRVVKVYAREGAATRAVDGLSFAVAAGEYVCIIGRTGCGKSTTLNLLLGLQRPTAGSVRVLGHDPHAEFDALRGRMSCIFQGDRLLPWRSLLDNVRLPLEILGVDEAALAVGPADWLRRVGLDGYADALPAQVSGGMRQRAAMARALASDPRIVLADEAFGHLDEVTGQRIKADFRALVRDTGKTVLHITHSIEEAIAMADRILVMGGGRLWAAHETEAATRAAGGTEALRRLLYAQVQEAGEAAPGAAHG